MEHLQADDADDPKKFCPLLKLKAGRTRLEDERESLGGNARRGMAFCMSCEYCGNEITGEHDPKQLGLTKVTITRYVSLGCPADDEIVKVMSRSPVKFKNPFKRFRFW